MFAFHGLILAFEGWQDNGPLGCVLPAGDFEISGRGKAKVVEEGPGHVLVFQTSGLGLIEHLLTGTVPSLMANVE